MNSALNTPEYVSQCNSRDNQDFVSDPDVTSPNRSCDQNIKLSLAKKSYDCLIRGINLFEEINDNANLAILLCNMGRFMRFRAHLEDENNFSFKKVCYESAFSSYEKALAILESKKQNFQLWNIVTWELSSGKFTLSELMLKHLGNISVSKMLIILI